MLSRAQVEHLVMKAMSLGLVRAVRGCALLLARGGAT
jgi:hypothetical protein